MFHMSHYVQPYQVQWGYPQNTYSIGYPLYSTRQYTYSREFPPVDPAVFTTSVMAFQSLMRDGNIILDRIAESDDFAYQLMDAAQKSDQVTVDQLIRSTGVSSDVKTSFTPDSIRFELRADVEGTDCCRLNMSLRW